MRTKVQRAQRALRWDEAAGRFRSERRPPPVVLVWCPMCERYIANEDRHDCDLPIEWYTKRRLQRLSKAKEVGGS